MNEDGYRDPEELEAQDEQDTRVQAVLDQAVQDGASLLAAMMLDESAEVVERWVDTLWNGLRDNLSDDRPGHAGLRCEDRLSAIVLLLTQRMQDEATQVLRAVRNVR